MLTNRELQTLRNMGNEAEEAADQGSGRNGSVASGQNIPKHGGSGPDELGKFCQFGAGAKGVHGWSIKIKIKVKMKSRPKSRWI